MKLHADKAMAVIAGLSALLIASHDTRVIGFGGLLSGYLYWLVRIAIEVAFFVGARALLEKYQTNSHSSLLSFIAATLISHVPYVLTVTAMDIVLGFPELGLGDSTVLNQSRFSAFGLEMIYLFDNHVIICLLVSLPHFLLPSTEALEEQSLVNPGTFLSTLEPPLKGAPLWVEAQEHYVRITTDQENRMVLARFSDVVRELEGTGGMQVHRSHWVSRSAVLKKKTEGQGVFLILKSGDRVPVSRSFRNQISDIEGLAG